jgi:hypothetical protein
MIRNARIHSYNTWITIRSQVNVVRSVAGDGQRAHVVADGHTAMIWFDVSLVGVTQSMRLRLHTGCALVVVGEKVCCTATVFRLQRQ